MAQGIRLLDKIKKSLFIQEKFHASKSFLKIYPLKGITLNIDCDMNEIYKALNHVNIESIQAHSLKLIIHLSLASHNWDINIPCIPIYAVAKQGISPGYALYVIVKAIFSNQFSFLKFRLVPHIMNKIALDRIQHRW